MSQTPSLPKYEVPLNPEGGPTSKYWYYFFQALSESSLQPSGVVAGSYVNPSITVNANGIITSATSGTTQGAVMPGASWASSGFSPIVTPVLQIPRAVYSTATLKEVLILTTGGTGSCVIDIWKANLGSHYPPTGADDITGGVPPSISAGTFYQNSTLLNWTTAIAKNDVFYFTLASNANFTSVQIFLGLQ